VQPAARNGSAVGDAMGSRGGDVLASGDCSMKRRGCDAGEPYCERWCGGSTGGG
jgi:hypothetical protein